MKILSELFIVNVNYLNLYILVQVYKVYFDVGILSGKTVLYTCMNLLEVKQ